MLESHNKVIREPHDDDIAVSLRLPPLLDPQVQYVVQVDIGQQRRDAAALNCTYLTHYPLTVLQHARIEPFLDQPNHAPVRYPILDKLHQPFMPQRVEEALKIGIQYPVSSSPSSSRSRMPRRPARGAGSAVAGIRKKILESPLRISRSTPPRRRAGRFCLPAPVHRAVASARPPFRCRHAELVLPGMRHAPAVQIDPSGFPPDSLHSAAMSLRRSPLPHRAPTHGMPAAVVPRHRYGAVAP